MSDIADLAAQLETLRLADVEARRQYAQAAREIADRRDYMDTLLLAIAQRRDRADVLLDEWLALRDAERVAEAMVD